MTYINWNSSLADEFSELKTELMKAKFCTVKDDILHSRDVILQNLCDVCSRIENFVSEIRSKIVDFENKYNLLEQYCRKNNFKISSISDSAEQINLEDEVIAIFNITKV